MDPLNPAPRLKHGDVTDKILRCFYDVYNDLGFGFLESVYHNALKIALEQAGLFVESRVKLPVYFRGYQVGDFEADLFVERLVIRNSKRWRRFCRRTRLKS